MKTPAAQPPRTAHRALALAAAWLACAATVLAQKTISNQELIRHMDAHKKPYEQMAMQIWDFAELGYKETRSSALLREKLRQEGFTIEAGVAGMPTAFVASFGKGHPIIGVIGEFDALPGLSQEAVPVRKPREGNTSGHGCGHNLFCSASAEAVVAIKHWLQITGRTGTIRYYGTPAEEGGGGKVYLVREGLFNDVDAVLHWHPSDRNYITYATNVANMSAKFRFRGVPSHASTFPERGRSALDAVESMNYMVNMMREHVPATTRIHYIITRGGEAPNVVPAFAESFYYVRSPDREIGRQVFERVADAARGAALGTGTTVDWEIIHGDYELLPNTTLARVMQAALEETGGVTYDEIELAFARELQKTLPPDQPNDLARATLIPPLPDKPIVKNGSTDVGDVSWVVPTMGVHTATWVPGTTGHSWQAAAAAGTTIGLKGMAVAAKTIALSAVALYSRPEIIVEAKAELEKRRGPNFKYQALVGDRAPPLNYRD